MDLRLGSLSQAVDLAIKEAEVNHVLKRIWRKDAELWKSDDDSQRVIRNSLGWLTVADDMRGAADELVEYANLIRERGFRHVMVCGMGGSSLCPEVLRQTFPRREGFAELLVLDSTDPDVVAALAEHIQIEKCLFIIASKSGSTIEPNAFYKFWYDQLGKLTSDPGENFVAITDPGSPMVKTATDLGFQRIFLNQADIGGRYSALSYFGLVPAALAGIDINRLLDSAKHVNQLCSAVMPLTSNPGVQLGAVLGECARAGRDKLTLVTDSKIPSLGLWIEQLIAESTGKEGKGIVPVAGETLSPPSVYGDDRLFVSISVGTVDETVRKQLEVLSAAGHPVVYRSLQDIHELGGEFFVWEFATAFAGWRLGINPFDQPNVQEAKQVTVELLETYKKEKRLPQESPLARDEMLSLYVDDPQRLSGSSPVVALRSFLETVRERDYVGLLSFTEETPEIEAIVQSIRTLLRESLHCATTSGYGPRFLHSTGQLHKGGPDSGVFLQVVVDDTTDLDVPGEAYSFSILKQAQAVGDFRALSRKGRRTLGVHIPTPSTAGFTHLFDLINEALASRSAATSNQ